ncbi:MAG: MarR family transcriptional regulator [Thalassobius sp.]|nr:MarR family transcriptional regulator [Thalassovita sp.]
MKINSAQKQILMVLKMKGAQPASVLAKELDMTNEGARLHLVKLADDGLVISENLSKGVGRPKVLFSLSDEGNKQFPDTHADLTIQLLNSVKELLGEAALDKLIEAREIKTTNNYLQQVEKSDDLESKLDTLVKLRSDEGYMAEWEKDQNDYFFIENHCPICAAATSCQGFCRAELNTFSKVLGDKVEIERVEHIVKGTRRCTYKVTPV